MTGAGSMVGAMVGNLVGQMFLQECLAFTTGGFLYFSINGIMGELKEVDSVFELIICTFFVVFGLYFMYVFALFE